MSIKSSNAELARSYFTYVAETRTEIEYYQKIKRIIREAPVDIRQFYEMRGSLQKLGIKGIGPKTREALEKVIRDESF